MTRISNRCLVSRGAIVALILVIPMAAWSAPITVPSDLNPGDPYRLAFLTTTVRNATSTSIADYNAFVTGVANSVPELLALGTTWTAIASTDTVDARDNTGTNPTVSTGIPIYTLGDTRIANDNADLWDGNLLMTLNIFEDGSGLSSGITWTGTNTAGTKSVPLGNGDPIIGRPEHTDAEWIQSIQRPNNRLFSLYAMSGPLVVPEPSTVILAGIGLVVIAAVGWRRRK